ncbi:DUF2795 domain-containing protein [Actinomadura sp. NPDC047616]|uniref:DUF2795 domain-containing protein n=1 Tax=Actinomadura sp. NPDC047616 TaxID=3155914 RepID=UPI0033D27D16
MHVNCVILCGRLADDPVRRPLTAGGMVVSWRLVVDRPRAPGARRVVDTITCAAFDARVRDDSATWRRDDLVKVHGSLRRRFWRAGDLRLGRHEVEVHEATLVAVDRPSPDAGHECPAHCRAGPPPRGGDMRLHDVEHIRELLGDLAFPADKDEIVEHARRHGADESEVKALSALPLGDYDGVHEVLRSVPVEPFPDRTESEKTYQRRHHTKPGLAEHMTDTERPPIEEELRED